MIDGHLDIIYSARILDDINDHQVSFFLVFFVDLLPQTFPSRRGSPSSHLSVCFWHACVSFTNLYVVSSPTYLHLDVTYLLDYD